MKSKQKQGTVEARIIYTWEEKSGRRGEENPGTSSNWEANSWTSPRLSPEYISNKYIYIFLYQWIKILLKWWPSTKKKNGGTEYYIFETAPVLGPRSKDMVCSSGRSVCSKECNFANSQISSGFGISTKSDCCYLNTFLWKCSWRESLLRPQTPSVEEVYIYWSGKGWDDSLYAWSWWQETILSDGFHVGPLPCWSDDVSRLLSSSMNSCVGCQR